MPQHAPTGDLQGDLHGSTYGDLYASYTERLRARGGGPDELVGGSAESRAVLEAAIGTLGLPGLLAACAESRRLIDEDGVTYGVTEGVADGSGDDGSDGGGQGRNWIVDPLPVVLAGAEWTSLERALEQRALVLDALLSDIYGPRSLIRRGIVPAEVVLGHPGFIRQMDGLSLPGPRQLLLTATDLGRDADGRWVAFADRLGAPSGAGYAMATRRITSRVLSSLHRSTRLTRLRPFFHSMTLALRESAPAGVDNPQVVMLSPGTGSETGYDQSFLAMLLGFPLVEADDLATRDARIWIRSTNRADQVDVVLNRVDADYVDPLELRADSQLGLAGLIEATRRGAVAVANPIGAGVLENPALALFLPAVAREVLGEELALPGVAGYWCGDSAQRNHVLRNLDSLVLKPIARGVGMAALPGWELSAAERDDLRRQIQDRPWAWVGQESLTMSTAPVVTSTGLEPRRFVLRTFGVARGDGYRFLPGGLGRVAPDEAAYVVANAAGALAKDVWVLAGDEAAPSWADDRKLDLRLVPGADEGAALALRAAEGLFWMGRYVERAELTARLLRVADDLIEDHASWPGTPGAAAMEVLVDTVIAVTGAGRRLSQGLAPRSRPLDVVRALVSDGAIPGSVTHAVRRLVRGAQEVRDQLSYDIWPVLSRIERTLSESQTHSQSQAHPQSQLDHVPLQPQLYRVLESMLAVHGVIAENMVRDEGWGFLDGGVRLERALLTTSLVRASIAREHPPIMDGQVTEAVLEACDSIITHRRRMATGEGPALPADSAVDLLIADETNPRSVAFCVIRLAADLRLLGDESLASVAMSLLDELRRADLEAACAGDRRGLVELCDRLDNALRDLSDRLTATHLRHRTTRQVPLADWSKPPLGAGG